MKKTDEIPSQQDSHRNEFAQVCLLRQNLKTGEGEED